MERRAFLIGVGALTASFALVFATLDPSRLVSIVDDGAGYYLAIARNIVAGRGCTFDGLHATNGFHPLWMAVLLVIFGAVHGSSETLYRVVGLLAVVLFAVATLTFHRTLRRLLSPPAALAGGAVFAASAFLNVNLMETALVLTATSALFAYAWHQREQGDRGIAARFGLGLVLGACILARLDAGFLALGIGVVEIAGIARQPEGRRRRVAQLAALVAGASVLVLPYLVANRIVFGAILPISGRIESLFPHINARGPRDTLRALGPVRVTFWLAGVAYLPVYVLWRRRHGDRATPRTRFLRGCVALMAAVSLVHAAHEVLFIRWQLRWHYWMLIPLGGGLAGVAFQEIVDRFPGRAPSRMAFAGLALILAVHGWVMQRHLRADTSGSRTSRLYDASLWIRGHVEPDARLAMRDAEITGFFGDRPIVDILGLGNGLELQEVIRGQRLRSYLAQSGVRYVAQVDFPQGLDGSARALAAGDYEGVAFRVVSELYGTPSDPILVGRAREAYHSPPYVTAGRTQAIVVWRLEPRPGE
jgi:hypothetical protein